jgi:hypothetical protein
LRQNIAFTGYSTLISFVSAVDPQLYYIMDFLAISIHVCNENWEYQRTITPPSNEYPTSGPAYSININGSIYVTADDVINKYDKYLNLTKQVSSYGSNTGIYYNSANQMIYIANAVDYNLYGSIKVFDKDLNFIRTIRTNYNPWFITGYNGQMVVNDEVRNKV